MLKTIELAHGECMDLEWWENMFQKALLTRSKWSLLHPSSLTLFYFTHSILCERCRIHMLWRWPGPRSSLFFIHFTLKVQNKHCIHRYKTLYYFYLIFLFIIEKHLYGSLSRFQHYLNLLVNLNAFSVIEKFLECWLINEKGHRKYVCGDNSFQ